MIMTRTRKEKYAKFRAEADSCVPHLTHHEKHEWAMQCVKEHPGFKRRSRIWTFLIILLLILLCVFLVRSAHGAPVPARFSGHDAEGNFLHYSIFPQLVTLPGAKFDASGNLDVNCITGCSASAGFSDNTAFTAGTTPINITGGWYSTSPTNCTSGNACAPQLSQDRKLFVEDFQGTSPWVVGGAVGQNTPSSVDRTATGTITSTQTVVISGQGATTINFQVTGSWTGTLTFEQTVDGSTWNLANCKQVPSGPIVQGTTVNGQFVYPAGGVNQFRVRGNSVSSGTATISLEAGQGAYVLQVTNLVAADLLTTSSQGTSPWIVAGGGTAGVPGTAVLTVQGIGSGTAVPVTLASTTVTNTVAENLTQVAGTALGSTAVTNFGTAPAAAAVPGVNASLFAGTTAVNQSGGNVGVDLEREAGTAITNTPTAIGTKGSGNVMSVNSDTTSIAGTATVTAAAGVQKVGIVGNANAAVDAANNASPPANNLAIGAVGISQGTQPTAITSTNMGRVLSTTEGALYVQQGNSNRFSCFVAVTSTATTQCQAAPAAGLRAYVTSAVVTDAVTTAQAIDIVYGTGSNCGTGTTALTAKWEFIGATETGSLNASQSFLTPLIPAAANAICCRPSNATAFGCTLTGYIAP